DDSARRLIVFVTADDQYAVPAFERAAVDYILRPVEPARLALTCTRLQAALKARDNTSAESLGSFGATLGRLRQLLEVSGVEDRMPRLSVLQASVGATIHMVPVAHVLYFEAADKYIRVITATREYLIRMSLRQLSQQLD